jgi:hypothetical protein
MPSAASEHAPSPEMILAGIRDAFATALRSSLPTTSAEHVHGCATPQVASWNRSSSCWATSRFKRRNDIWAANSGFEVL